MREIYRKKDRGFVFVFVVISLAVILGIFFRYSMEARAKKGYQIISKTSSDMNAAVNQSLSFGIYETYIMDQLIAKNSEGVQDYLGYFIVKDIAANNGKFQRDTEKVWMTGSSQNNSGIWTRIKKLNSGGSFSAKYNGIVGGAWSFTEIPFPNTLNMSKGGFFINYIKNMDLSQNSDSDPTNDIYLYTANEDGTKKTGQNGDIIQQDLVTYWNTASKKSAYPIYEIQMVKNIMLKTNDGRYVKDFDVIVTLRLYYPQMGSLVAQSDIDSASRYPYPMLDNLLTPDVSLLLTPQTTTVVGPILVTPDPVVNIVQTIPITAASAPTYTKISSVVSTVSADEDEKKSCPENVIGTPQKIGNADDPTITIAPIYDSTMMYTVQTQTYVNGVTTIYFEKHTPYVGVVTNTNSDIWQKINKTYVYNNSSKNCTLTTDTYKGTQIVYGQTISTVTKEKVEKTVTTTTDPVYRASSIVSYEVNFVGP